MRLAAIAMALLAVPLAASGEIPCGAPGVTARVDPEVALPGESILVTVTNGSNQTIEIPYSCLFDSVFAVEGLERVLTLICLDFPITVLPGESVDQSWDQRNNSGEQVPDGKYFFFVRTGSGFAYFCGPEVEIAAGVPALTHWGMSALGAVVGLARSWILRRRGVRPA